MKKIYTYISMLMLLLATACQQDELVSSPTLQPGEYRFTATVPEPIVASRALGEQPQNVEEMPMRVLVFDANGFYMATQVASVTAFDDAKQTGTYTVNLPKSDEKTILHFVLGNVALEEYSPSASEVSIFSNLTVEDGEDAYWQRIEMNDGIQEGTVLPFVNLIRNFAKIDVKLGEGDHAGFEYLGFAVVNETTAGTVAPYTGSRFARFENLGEGDVYTNFRNVNDGYAGITVPETVDRTAPVDADFTTAAKYVYERNQDNAESPAYVLVKARYNNDVCYYKLDIVKWDEDTWVTSYLNLYRNFAYTISIGAVNGKGYESIEEAMRAVASNNISASVEVSEVNSIQDGDGRELTVDNLDIMLVSTKPYELGFSYTVNDGDTPANDKVKVIPVNGEDEGGYNHDAVQSVEITSTAAEGGIITITPVNPLPDIMETQEFIVTTENGLSRRVTVNVRKPFEFDAVDCDDYVESIIGSELTVVVRLPENMPTSVFPLTLNIEPDKKSIYPDVAKNRIPVVSEGNYTFKYQTTVTYEEYRKNHTLFFHFKTNMTASATSITVSNPYFEATAEHPNVCSFANGDVVRTDFGKVTLNGTEDIYKFGSYDTEGQQLTLAFDLPCGSADHKDASLKPIEIYADYLDLANAKTTTGTFTLRGDGECILYTANDPTERQEITFTVTRDYASETVQISSFDHKTATIDYTTPALEITVQYRYQDWWQWHTDPLPSGTEVTWYKDANYSEEIDTKTANQSGLITIDTFVGFSENDYIYFEAGISSGRFTTYYRGSKTVKDLVSNPTITLQEAD